MSEYKPRVWQHTRELMQDLEPIAKENRAVEIVIQKYTQILEDVKESTTQDEFQRHITRGAGIIPIIRALWREYVEQA